MIDKLADLTARVEAGDTAARLLCRPWRGDRRRQLSGAERRAARGRMARKRACAAARSRKADIVAELQGKCVRVALLVIDACRDNPFPRSGGRSIGNTRGLADARPARGVFTLYSAGIGQTALDRLERQRYRAQFGFHARLRRAAGEAGPAPRRSGGRGARARRRARAAGDQRQRPAGAARADAGLLRPDHRRAHLSWPWLERPTHCGFAASPQRAATDGRAVRRRPSAAVRPQRPGAAGERCARNGAETYCVSSVLTPQFGNSYGPENLFAAAGQRRMGRGPARARHRRVDHGRIRRDCAPMRFRSSLRNGYQKSTDIFRQEQPRAASAGGVFARRDP